MVPHQPGQQAQRIRLHVKCSMRRAQQVGHLPGIGRFVKASITGETDAERAHGGIGGLLHQGHDQAAVQPAT